MKFESVLKLSALDAAPKLLGHNLCRALPEGVIKLKIVETEAYHQDDPASHSFKWKTARTAPMFEAGGCLYVYFTYGVHYCINIVTGSKGVGEAVLIRAGEPVEGLEVMTNNRGGVSIHHIADGPGKLAQALGIKDTKLSGEMLSRNTIWLEPPEQKIDAENILATPRIGISRAADMPWRFHIKENPFVSKKL